MQATVMRFTWLHIFAAAIATLGAFANAQAQTVYQWNGTTNTDWGTAGNWQSSTVGATPGTINARLNVYNGTGQRLVYSAAQGTTVYANANGRGLVISNATNAVAGSMEITGGSFSTLGSTQADVIGNAAAATLTVSGGSFIGSNAGTNVGLNGASGTSTLNVSGSATLAVLTMNALNSTINLNAGGQLTATSIVKAAGTATFNFDGGTLRARTGTPGFMTGLNFAYVQSGGATIDTNSFDVTIAQSLLAPASGTSGGLMKTGSGTLALTGSSTYSNATTVAAGTLLVNGSLAAASAVSVASGATLGGSGTIGGPTSILGGGILAPGTSPGTLTIGNMLALNPASILGFEIDAVSTSPGGLNDLITGVTDLTLGGTLNLAGTGDFTTVTQGTSWRLINYTGSLGGTPPTIGTAPTLAAGLSFEVDTSTANQVNLVVVPEPTSLVLTGLGLAAANWLVHRQRRRS